MDRRTVKQWWKDQTTKDDLYTGPPQKHIRNFRSEMERMTPEVRSDEYNRVGRYANWYYERHQNERAINPSVRNEMAKLAEDVRHLNAAEIAEKRLREIGPPTRLTLDQALNKSALERDQIRTGTHEKGIPELKLDRVEAKEHAPKASRKEASRERDMSASRENSL